MAAIGTPSSDAADLLQKLSLESHTKSLEVHENPKKFGSMASRNPINSLAKPYERSALPIQDYANLNMYYQHGGYPYYYGGYDESLNMWSDYAYLNHDAVNMHSGMQQRRMNSGMGQTGGHMGRSHLNEQLYGNFENTYRSGSGFGLNYYNPKSTWNSWRTVDNKYNSKGRSSGFFNYGNENKDTLNELSKGPRAKDVKNQLGFGSVKLAVKGQDLSVKVDNKEEKLSLIPDKDQYNKDDFPESFKDARFFIIKSYSEDDVHKSVKYNVWASTPNGNKKLDAAYQEAKGKPEGCPVFLLFSVNASGQFVGLAEMVGAVDFNKSMDFWQQDKWTGCFPVKWHIVKDVPNNLLKHITLENNDNKPVTNSRDTQEVKLEQAVQVLKIFKSHPSKTSVLDDFEFYEARQRALQEKKAKRQQFQKQVKNDNESGDDKLLKSLDADAAAAAFIEGSATTPVPSSQANGHQESGARNVASADVTEGAKAEKAAGTDGVASAC